jgi:glycosyltransferase involved in cell wall biosynthesis
MPKVSVIVPCYNRGDRVVACVESALRQTFEDIEVVVVDDHSSDDTRERVGSIPDPRVRYLRHDVNRGGNAARNTGIAAARGELIAFLDSDDRWAPDKLERQVRLLQERGGRYGLCYTWVILRDPSGEELGRTGRAIDGLAVPELLVENSIGTFSSVVARRDLLVQVGGLDEKMRSCQDWDLYVRLNAITGVCCVREHLVDYEQNRTDRHRISANPASIVLGRRRMLQKLQSRLEGLPSEARVASLLGFSNDFAAAGAVGDVLRTGWRIVSIAPTPVSLLRVMHAFARVVKRNLTRDFGY